MSIQVSVTDTTLVLDQFQSIVHEFIQDNLERQLEEKGMDISELRSKLKKYEWDTKKKNKFFDTISIMKMMNKSFALKWAKLFSHAPNQMHFIFALDTGKLIDR